MVKGREGPQVQEIIFTAHHIGFGVVRRQRTGGPSVAGGRGFGALRALACAASMGSVSNAKEFPRARAQ